MYIHVHTAWHGLVKWGRTAHIHMIHLSFGMAQSTMGEQHTYMHTYITWHGPIGFWRNSTYTCPHTSHEPAGFIVREQHIYIQYTLHYTAQSNAGVQHILYKPKE